MENTAVVIATVVDATIIVPADVVAAGVSAADGNKATIASAVMWSGKASRE